MDFERWDQEVEGADPSNKQRLYNQMKSELKASEVKSEVLWRLAKVCLVLSIGANKENRKDFQRHKTEEALGYGRKACELNPNNANCHKWYCAALGAMAKFVGAKQKLRYGQKFKEHADIALKLDPNDYLLHFMFGRFCYEMSSLTWIERKIANTLFGSVPKASYDEALRHFRKCDQLKNEWKESYLWIARTLIALNKHNEAKVWVRNGLELSVNNMMDEMTHKNLNQLKTQHKL